jgi:hypothetical protein
MAAFAKVGVSVVAYTGNFTNGMRRAQQSVKGFADSANSARPSLQGLNQAFGAQSGLGAFGKLLTGGGAVAGLTLMGKALSDAAEGMRAMSAEIIAGNAGMASLVGNVGESLPGIGALVKGATEFNFALDDSAAAFGKLIGLSEQQVASARSWTTQAKEAATAYAVIEKIQDGTAAARRELTELTLKGVDRERAAVQNRYEAEMEEIAKLREALPNVADPNTRRNMRESLAEREGVAAQKRDQGLSNVDQKEAQRVADERYADYDANRKVEEQQQAAAEANYRQTGLMMDEVRSKQRELNALKLKGPAAEKAAIEDRYQLERDRLNELRRDVEKVKDEKTRIARQGIIDQEFDLAKQKRDAELAKLKTDTADSIKGGPKTIGAAERGTSEAVSSISRAQQGWAETAQHMAQLKALNKENNQLLTALEGLGRKLLEALAGPAAGAAGFLGLGGGG